MFSNWYDPATGAELTTWPVDGNPVYPFLSSVDNGWMAAALLMVGNAVPELRGQARDLLAPMAFGSYYDPAAGLLRGGFWVDPPGGQCTIPGNYYWGFSPSNNPSGGYREDGVDAIGLNPGGYASNNDNTLVDYGFGDCRPARPLPPLEA
jgi:hypothetical protein